MRRLLTNVFKAHFTPKPSEIVQRFKFNSHMRKSSESTDGCMQRRLLSELDLMFDKAMKLSQAEICIEGCERSAS